MDKKLVTIIMAGGMGKRMQSEIPKVLHTINDKPMICYIIDKALEIKSDKILIVVGNYAKQIHDTICMYYNTSNMPIEYVFQKDPLGTGHCVQCCMTFLNENFHGDDNILILSGDVPLIGSETLNSVIERCDSLLITNNANPYGYGRILISNNYVQRIIEEKDCTDEEKCITDVNCGVYCVKLDTLNNTIYKITNNNMNGEYYLPDIINFSSFNYCRLPIDKIHEICNVNTQKDLEHIKNLIEIHN